MSDDSSDKSSDINSVSHADAYSAFAASVSSVSSDMESESARPAAALCEFLALHGIATKSKTCYFANSFECETLPPNMFIDMWRHLKKHKNRSIVSFDDFLRKCGITSVERVVFVHDGNEAEKLDSVWKDRWRAHLAIQKDEGV